MIIKAWSNDSAGHDGFFDFMDTLNSHFKHQATGSNP
jgi:hypothetical protein